MNILEPKFDRESLIQITGGQRSSLTRTCNPQMIYSFNVKSGVYDELLSRLEYDEHDKSVCELKRVIKKYILC